MKHILYFTKRIHSFSGKILYINLIAMILVSLFEGIGIFLLVPLLGIIGIFKINSESASSISWINQFFDHIPETLRLAIILCSYISLIIAQGYFQRNQKILNVRIQQAFTGHLREETYRALIQANWSFFLRKRKSDIINFMTTEIGRVSAGLNMFLQFIASLVFNLIQMVIAFWLSPTMTVSILLFGLALIFFSRKYIKKSNTFGNEATELSKIYLAGMTDQFNGIKDIKGNSLEDSHIHWFHSISKRMEQNIVEFVKISTISQYLYKVVSAILIALFIFISFKIFKVHPSQLMLIIVIFSRLWPRISSIQSNLEQLGNIIPAFKAMIDLQNECQQEREIFNDNYKKINTIKFEQNIECKNVFFRYNQNVSSYALQEINVKIPSNCMTAIAGRSGAGKSTFIDLLMGLNRPETGEILIDGVPLTNNDLLKLRKSISYVPQDPFLFNGTIRDNLLLINADATEEQMWEALNFASAAEFVNRLPNSLDTLIGDRGVRLSGGERQRIVLARAILRKPSILILDEATSALDTENETKIQEAIDRLKGTMTIIVIAHRLSTIRNADQVIVLDGGKIVQIGGFNKLANEKKSIFRNLLVKQMETQVYN